MKFDPRVFALTVVTIVGRVCYLAHSLTAGDGAAKRFRLTFGSRSRERSSCRVSWKPKNILRVPRHGQRKFRPRPRHCKTVGQPPCSTLATETKEWEKYMPDYFPRFLHLPLEMREKIYDFAMDGLSTRYFVQTSKQMSSLTVSPATLPYLCVASKQLHEEALAVWIRRTRFTVSKSVHIAPLMSFLSRVDGFKHVRMLFYGDLVSYGTDRRIFRPDSRTHQHLAAKCTGLNSLILGLDAFSLMESTSLGTQVILSSKKELKKKLLLGPVFQLHNLRKLKIEAIIPSFQIESFVRQEGMNGLAEIVTEGFEAVEKGGAVQVQFEMTAWKYE
jgi:hypothetical protein